MERVVGVQLVNAPQQASIDGGFDRPSPSTYALDAANVGQPVDIVVMRDGQGGERERDRAK